MSPDRFLQHIAPTPLVSVTLEPGGPAIWCKLEFLNPSGSTKDRIARYMLEKAWRHGEVTTGSVVVEAQIPGGTVHGTIVGLHGAFAEAGCPVVPFVARPTVGSEPRELECCSFSPMVPGVIDGLSKLFLAADLKDLVTLAINTARALIRRGFPVGPSSGLNYAAAVEAAKRLGADAHVVTVFPDRMERYFSTGLIEAISLPS